MLILAVVAVALIAIALLKFFGLLARVGIVVFLVALAVAIAEPRWFAQATAAVQHTVNAQKWLP